MLRNFFARTNPDFTNRKPLANRQQSDDGLARNDLRLRFRRGKFDIAL